MIELRKSWNLQSSVFTDYKWLVSETYFVLQCAEFSWLDIAWILKGPVVGFTFVSLCWITGSPTSILGFTKSCYFWRIQLHYFVSSLVSKDRATLPGRILDLFIYSTASPWGRGGNAWTFRFSTSFDTPWVPKFLSFISDNSFFFFL